MCICSRNTNFGGTPSARIDAMGVDGLSPELAISLLMGTPIIGKSNGRTWTVTLGVLKGDKVSLDKYVPRTYI